MGFGTRGERESDRQATGRSQNEATMAWAQVAAVETEGERAGPGKFSEK